MNEKPNILILFTDQQRFDTINAAGFPHMKTPNMNRLVQEGCLFLNAYTPNPVCVPARHNLMTGLPARFHGYAANYGHSLDHRIPVLPRILSNHGYETRAIGKMHFQPFRRHSGFDKMELMEEIPRWREQDEYAMYLKSVGLGHIQNIHGVRNLLYMVPQRSLIPEEHHGSTWVGDRSAAFIRNNKGRHPFFLWSSWIAPHPPFDVPDTFADLYNDVDIPKPHISESEISERAQRTKWSADLPDSEYLTRMRQLYYSAISLVDKNVGKILDALEETGQVDHTIIIFTSDHGEMLGDYGCFQKGLPYDSCSHIPFIIRYPHKFKPGTVDKRFVDLNDILPTILSLSGIEYPGPYKLPGGSLGDNKDAKGREFQYMEFGEENRRWVSMRDRKYKYNYYYEGGYEELFDTEHDPYETSNLLLSDAGNEIAAIKNYLKEKLIQHEKKWGLKNYVTWEDEFLRLEPVKGIPGRNQQFPLFINKITDEEEKKGMNTVGEEVLEAVKDEPAVKLHELDLESWEQNGAPRDFIERIRKEKL